MDRHTHSHEVSRLSVIETGRRRRWTDDEKLRIIAESERGPRQVSSTARRHGMSPSQLFGWRRDFGVGRVRQELAVQPAFLPVSVCGAVAERQAAISWIEIELSGGRMIRIDAGIDAEALARILEVVDRRS